MSTTDKAAADTRRGASWTPPADGAQCFEAALDEGSPEETCLHCGKLIRNHYGGTEYRCDPRSDSQTVAIYDENDEHPPVEVRRGSSAIDDEAGFIRDATYRLMRRPRTAAEGPTQKPRAAEAEYVADNVARLWREHRASAQGGAAARADHIYQGHCPDDLQPSARDANCPVCRVDVERDAERAALRAEVERLLAERAALADAMGIRTRDKQPSGIALLTQAKTLAQYQDDAGRGVRQFQEAVCGALGDGWKAREGAIVQRISEEIRATRAEVERLTRERDAEATRKDAALKRAADAEAARVVDWNARRAAEAAATSLRERLAALETLIDGLPHASSCVTICGLGDWILKPCDCWKSKVRAPAVTPQQPAADCLACAKVSRSSDPGLVCAIHGTRAPGAPKQAPLDPTKPPAGALVPAIDHSLAIHHVRPDDSTRTLCGMLSQGLEDQSGWRHGVDFDASGGPVNGKAEPGGRAIRIREWIAAGVRGSLADFACGGCRAAQAGWTAADAERAPQPPPMEGP